MKLAIDPSINDVGWSTVSEEGEYEWGYISVPPKIQELDARCAYICQQLPVQEVDRLIIEYPQWMNCDRGQIAAQQGYTIALGYVCGYISHHFKDAALFLYTPNQWKGQLPKKAVQARFLRLFGDEHKHVVSHAYEATMMLYYHQHGQLI